MADEEELEQESPVVEKPTLDRRLLRSGTVIYPYTKQENVIGLQGTIKEKMTIASDYEPESGTYIEKQIWLDTGDGTPPPQLNMTRSGSGLRTMATTSVEPLANSNNNVDGLRFGRRSRRRRRTRTADESAESTSSNTNLRFGRHSHGSLSFGRPNPGNRLRFGRQR